MGDLANPNFPTADSMGKMVGDTGLDPVTSCMSSNFRLLACVCICEYLLAEKDLLRDRRLVSVSFCTPVLV